MDGLDVRRLVPVDHRYGSVKYQFHQQWQWVISNDLYNLFDVMLKENPSRTVIWWWGNDVPAHHEMIILHAGRTLSQMQSEIAYWLGSIVQSTSHNGYIDNHPADPLV
jgi:hypothetical protein